MMAATTAAVKKDAALFRYAAETKWGNRMAYFRHRRGRILFEIFAALLLASTAGARWLAGYSTRSLYVAGAILLYAVFRAFMLFSRNPALAWDQHGVRMGRLFQVCAYPWSDVREARAVHWKRPSIPYLNWLPKERDYIELLIKVPKVESRCFKLRPEMVELPPGGVKQIIDDIRAAQIAVLGERRAA